MSPRETFRNRSVLLSPPEYYSRPNTLAFIRHRLCGSPEFVDKIVMDKILVVKRIVVKRIVRIHVSTSTLCLFSLVFMLELAKKSQKS
ncbi:hypothetical protein YC2023_090946 [Brassica napus]